MYIMDGNSKYIIKNHLKYKVNPWGHQILGTEYLYNHNFAGLFTDPGTGKTKMTIDAIINRGFKIVLIICTAAGAKYVWPKEIVKYSYTLPEDIVQLCEVSTHKKVLLMQKSLESAKKNNKQGPLWVLVNYEGVWRTEFAKFLLKKTTKLDCIVCDESHRIKSPGSKCSRFLAQLSKKTPARWVLTGTPFAENPMDIYAQYRFLDPTIFGTRFADFKSKYQNLDVHLSAAVGFPVLDKKNPYKNLDDLKKKAYSIAFRIPSTVKLPSVNERIVDFDLNKKATNLYNTMVKEGLIANSKYYCEAENALTSQIRRKQITSGFISAVNYETKQKKLFKIGDERKEALKSILESLPYNEPVVIFAQYRYDLKQIRKVAKEMGRKYSELSGAEDTEQEWQEGNSTILGVQFSKGSESVNLTRAHYQIYYNMTNKLVLYEQSLKRVHRPGQTKPVYYYYIVAHLSNGKPCIDSLVMEAIQKKQDIVQYVMEKEGII